MDSEELKKLGRYEILHRIGVGGMGEVYLAQDTKLDRKVALKILPSDVGSQDRVLRFIQEARAASALNHPNILTIYEIDEIDTMHFIVTEFIEGETLRARISKGPIETVDAIDIGLQIVNALCATHAVGIVHRDIKPDNIMLRSDGLVKVLDFGLAKISRDPLSTPRSSEATTHVRTEPGVVLGTVQYMSPEQARGLEVDARTDIWSVGCVLYEILSSRQPFSGATPIDLMSDILNKEPDPLSTFISDRSHDFDRIVSRTLRKDREQRYQSAKDLLHDLTDLQYEIGSKIKSGSALTTRFDPVSSADAVPEKSIAVLYFENMNSNDESDYFCAGITEDIITDLSKINHLKVVPRTDVLPFRNKNVNTRQVGEALRVNYILEGSVRTAGKRIRITAKLINTRDGYQVWAERFDSLVDDIFDLQNEVSQRIADALKISLTESEKQLIAKKPTDDLRAYDVYLHGKELLYLKGKKNIEKAIAKFEEAIAIDNNFASAYAGLAEAYSQMYEWYDGDPVWLGKAIETNQKALALDPQLLEAQFGIAMVYFHHRRFAESTRTIEDILRKNSEFHPGYLRLGMIADLSGQLERALQYYRRATELKPYDEDSWRFLSDVNRKLGNIDEAETAALKVIEVTSRKLEASLDDITVMSRLAEAYARFGSREETHATLKRVFELEPNDGLAVYNCSCAYAFLGEKELALVSLQRAFDSGFRTVAHWARTDSAFDLMREDAQFQRLIAELQ